MRLHKRQIFGGIIGGVAVGLVVARVLEGHFELRPLEYSRSVIGLMGLAGALVIGGGRITWPAGDGGSSKEGQERGFIIRGFEVQKIGSFVWGHITEVCSRQGHQSRGLLAQPGCRLACR